MSANPNDQAGSSVNSDDLSACATDRRHPFPEPDTPILSHHHPDVKASSTNTLEKAPSRALLPIKSLSSEIFFLVLAAASLIGLLALFKRYDHKPTPQWSLGSWGVTLNAIISIVSAIFRGSLMMPVAQTISQFTWIWYMQPRPFQDLVYYDSASRGPLGSFRLLLRLRFM